MNTDDLLKKLDLTYDQLNYQERETLDQWYSELANKQLTIDKIRDYVNHMRDSVIEEMSDYKNGSKQDFMLKARLKNYTLLLAFLSTPEKAKKAIERATTSLT